MHAEQQGRHSDKHSGETGEGRQMSAGKQAQASARAADEQGRQKNSPRQDSHGELAFFLFGDIRGSRT